MSEHTPTPWYLAPIAGRNGRNKVAISGHQFCVTQMDITDPENKANARRIVHCVNHFDELVEALEDLLELSKRGFVPEELIPIYRKARNALEKINA